MPKTINLKNEDRMDWQLGCKRWAQVGFWEIDPDGADISWWTDVLRRMHIDGLIINAGPSYTFYPSKLPINRSCFLGDRDLFGEFVAAAKSLDIYVLARIDSWGIHPKIYHDHPDWVITDENGRTRQYRTSELLAVCPSTPYVWDFIPDVIREVVGTYDVDGIFDRGGGMLHAGADGFLDSDGFPFCHCIHCRRRFEEETGAPMPVKKDWNDLSLRQWLHWRYTLEVDLWAHLDAVTRSVKPWAFWQGNLPGGDLDRVLIGGPHWRRLVDKAAQLALDHQGRGVHTPPTRSGEMFKLLRVAAEGKPAYGNFGGWHGIHPDIKRAASLPDADLALLMAETVASGVRPYWHAVGATRQDRRWVGVVEPFYKWHAENEAYLLGDRSSTAEVALLFPKRTIDYYGGNDPQERVCAGLHGMYHALLKARIAFDWMLEDALTAEPSEKTNERTLSSYSVLVLSNSACLSDDQCRAIKKFVRDGGSIVATFETSLYDEQGEPRDDFGLFEILGVHRTGVVRGPLGHVYQLVRESRHPILSFVSDTDSIVFNGSLCTVSIEPGVDVLATLIPHSPMNPPECAWQPIRETATPTLVARQDGKSRVVYFPGDTDRQVWKNNSMDMYKTLGAAVRWALNGAQMVEVEGPGLVDVQPYISDKAVTVHIVNLNQAGFWKAPVDEITPLPAQAVKVKLPKGRGIGPVKLLVSGQEATAHVENGIATVDVSSIAGAHEVIVLELE